MTTNLFTAALDKFRGRPKSPVAVPANFQQSSTFGLAPAQLAAPFPSQPAEISPKPAKPFLEDIPTKFRFGMQQISIGGHSTSEMGGKHERSGSFVDGR